MATTSEPSVPIRTQMAVYGAGAFSNSMANFAGVLVPLWVVTFGVSGSLIGLVFGVRHLLPMILSIHGGALMDRLGTRSVMLFFAAVNASVPLLFPLFPNVWAAMAIQAVAGFATSMGWVGAQTLIGQVMSGSATHAGRLTLAVRVGHLAGPVLAGAAWDLAGPWGAFFTMSVWGWLGFLAALCLPSPQPGADAPRKRIAGRDLRFRWSDYVAAFRMLAVPAILFVMMITMLRNAGNIVQHSFYVVYLDEVVGMAGTAIGILTSFAAITGVGGALSVGPLSRKFPSQWLLLLTVAGAVVMITLTPLLGGFILLAAAIGLRGAFLGISQPLMISMLARAAGGEDHGKRVGLRNTANRLTGFVVPILMGALVDVVGIENGFYLIGGTVVFLLVLVGAWAFRRPGMEGPE